MGRIAVFDSGLGSLTIIKAIQKNTKADIIYFADQKNFPYGGKSKAELEQIIKNTINGLKNKFNPDLIVIGSNTPSLLLNKFINNDPRLIGVLPPLSLAQKITKTNSIALLVTQSVAKSSALNNFIKANLTSKIKVSKINSSELVELVESAKFIYDKDFCIRKIISTLQTIFIKNNIDTATLSSTHLPFLFPLLQKIFPNVTFLDPADAVAKQIIKNKMFVPSSKNTLKIFTSGNVKTFHNHLQKIGIHNSVQKLIL
ncbi:MAG TPA: glutamate racemase [Candidatus Nitrosotenuis sp.]|jgi:glutamate racemase|nr:glutamate racemase [Candidatus Nitrosotenuis sp.]